MKLVFGTCLLWLLASGAAQAMMRVDAAPAPASAPTSAPAPTVAPVAAPGKVGAIYAAAGKMVIGGVTYAYDPLHTVVTLGERRVTISDIRVGDSVQMQANARGAYQAPMLTRIAIVRP
jgi:hypothetical protein